MITRLKAALPVVFIGFALAALGLFTSTVVLQAQASFGVRYTFTGTNGKYPQAPLVQGSDGFIYGTTSQGGANNLGTIFRMASNGAVTLLHSFAGAPDPFSDHIATLLQASDGNLYGTTDAHTGHGGQIFRMTPAGSVTFLKTFVDNGTVAPEGYSPKGGLIQAADGNLYGTTAMGGTANRGTIFKITTGGTFTKLYDFPGAPSAYYPMAALLQANDGNFYGTTGYGGAADGGTIFRMTPGGTVTVLHQFPDLARPDGALIQATDGDLYGTTIFGGTGSGKIFRMTLGGTVTVVKALNGTTDGGNIYGPLTPATDGNFYGTVASGSGATIFGGIFRLGSDGVYTLVHALAANPEGYNPRAGVIQATDGFLYGTSNQGGASGGFGVIYRMGITTGPTTPPTTVTGAATGVGVSSATLHGTANPNGASTTGSFQYGLTTGYGSTTPGQALGSGSVPVSIGGGAISGLACSTQYHFRAVATNSGGTTAGSDATFVTSPCTATGDFDGDRKTDVAVFRPSTGTWWMLQSSTNNTTYVSQTWGVNTDIPVPGDYDGDGKIDVAVFRPSTGTWWILQSSTNNTTYVSQTWGANADIPVPGDYDGDGKTDVAVFRPSTGTWWIVQSSTNNATYVSRTWGVNTDIPVPGDYDGDGKTDVAVFRPSTGTWWIVQSSTNNTTYVSQTWGANTDIPVPGDYDGDGKTDVAIFRPSTGTWWILKSSTNNTTNVSQTWGADTDIPVPGDYDGDGKTDVAVFRPSTGMWWMLQSSTSNTTYAAQAWGVSTDTPVVHRP